MTTRTIPRCRSPIQTAWEEAEAETGAAAAEATRAAQEAATALIVKSPEEADGRPRERALKAAAEAARKAQKAATLGIEHGAQIARTFH